MEILHRMYCSTSFSATTKSTPPTGQARSGVVGGGVRPFYRGNRPGPRVAPVGQHARASVARGRGWQARERLVAAPVPSAVPHAPDSLTFCDVESTGIHATSKIT